MTATSQAPTMDALVWLGPRQMVLRPEPIPEPAADEVLIQVQAVGICGSELSGYLGHNSLRRPPLIMGHEAAGEVIAVGGGVGADGAVPKVGTRVTFNPLIVCGECERCQGGHSNLCPQRKLVGAHRPGAFAPYVAVPTSQCLTLPDDLSTLAGSLTEQLACAVRAVGLAGLRAKQHLLILGAGPIGLCCVAVARTQGITDITVSDVMEERLAAARSWGASEVINARAQDVVATLQGRGASVDVVIDAVGATAVRAQALRAVAPGGRVVCVGLHDEESPLPVNLLVRQEITITGSFAYTSDDFTQALNLLARREVAPAADWVQERPLQDGADAFAELVDGKVAAAKIVLRPA